MHLKHLITNIFHEIFELQVILSIHLIHSILPLYWIHQSNGFLKTLANSQFSFSYSYYSVDKNPHIVPVSITIRNL